MQADPYDSDSDLNRAPDPPPVGSETVIAAEWREIRRRRGQANYEPDQSTDHPDALTGLALSGGGIRSATFSLGVLQALQRSGLLRTIDLLSTVSGGGFTGGWWTAWMSRPETEGLFPPPERIVPNRTMPIASRAELAGPLTSAGVDPIAHLRLFANYLTPRKGLLSGDTWRAVTVIPRNLLLTWAVLVPILLGVILLADVYFIAFDATWLGHHGERALWGRRAWLTAAPVLAIAGWLVALTIVWLHFGRAPRRIALLTSACGFMIVTALLFALWPIGRPGPAVSIDRRSWIVWLLLGIGLVAFATWVPADAVGIERREIIRNRIIRVHTILLVTMLVTGAVLLFAGFGHELGYYLAFEEAPRSEWAQWITRQGGWLAVISSIAGAIFTAWRTAPTGAGDAAAAEPPDRVTQVIFAVTPPLVLVVLSLALAWSAHGALDLLSRNQTRSLPLMGFAAGVTFVLCATFALDEAIQLALPWPRARFWAVPTGAAVLLLSVGIYAVGAGNRWSPATRTLVIVMSVVLAAASVVWICALVFVRRRQFGANTRPLWLLLGGSAGLGAVLAATAFGGPPLQLVLTLAAATGGWTLGIGWTVDPNLLSLHTFYRARLVRAYLGASNRARQERDITESAPGDELKLSNALAAIDRGGPYHLVNSTLNLVGGRDLTTAQRSSDRFLLSPLYCGSTKTLYRPTTEYMGGGLELGTSVAISGAAVSPTMGQLTPSAALTMLMTLMNVRLGYWAPSPNKPRWRAPRASLWPFYALYEMLSQTNELASFCYLTDGGHFDNSGLYSLVERGCRHIILVDCSADARPSFEDLGTALRRVRIDFGTQIELELDRMLRTQPRRTGDYAESHILAGTIRYSAEHAETLGRRREPFEGTIVILKPVRVGDEPADVRQYGFQNATFPNQVTSDQWFDEAQFESYRRLGEMSARALVDPVAAELEALLDPASPVQAGTINRLFESIQRHASPPPPIE